MKQIKYLAILTMAVLTLGAVCACGDDDDDTISNGSVVENSDPVSRLVGTWTGTDSYGMRCEYTFKADGTGSGISSNSDVTNRWTFTYVIDGNRVKCGGMNYYSGQGESGESYVTMTFILNGTSLTDEWGKTTFRKR